MCGIKFNTDELDNRCQHCRKLAFEESPEFHTKLGIWLCNDCWELKENELKEKVLTENNK